MLSQETRFCPCALARCTLISVFGNKPFDARRFQVQACGLGNPVVRHTRFDDINQQKPTRWDVPSVTACGVNRLPTPSSKSRRETRRLLPRRGVRRPCH